MDRLGSPVALKLAGIGATKWLVASKTTAAAETFIAADTRVEGTLVARRGRVTIRGRVTHGVRTSNDVHVEAGGDIDGGVSGARLDLAGQVHGPVSLSGELRVRRGAVCRGPVSCSRLDADDDAEIAGVLRCHGGDPASSSSLRAEAEAEASTQAEPGPTGEPTRQSAANDHVYTALTAANGWTLRAEPLSTRSRAPARAPMSWGSRWGSRCPSSTAGSTRRWRPRLGQLGSRPLGRLSMPMALLLLAPFDPPIVSVPTETLAIPEPPAPTAMHYVWIPDEPRFEHGRVQPFDEIAWAADGETTLRTYAARWGVGLIDLIELNPDLNQFLPVPSGTPIRVYAALPEQTAWSIGAPNHGELVDGLPMPEGRHWELRTHRHRVYGTTSTIRALVSVFGEYGRRFVDAPPVRVGDLSARHGHTLPPHRSHQTGRDVDIFYVRSDGLKRGYLTRERFDAEKNWFLVRRLIDTGEVQSIFMAHRLRRWIEQVAARELPRARVREYMALITGDRDHKTHMHVRFRCMPGNRRCYEHSVGERRRRAAVALASAPTDDAGDGAVETYDVDAELVVHGSK